MIYCVSTQMSGAFFSYCFCDRCCQPNPKPDARWNTATLTPTRELAGLKKTIYSLIDLREILLGCNRRYLEFISAIDDTSSGQRDLARLCEPQREDDRTIKELNFFERTEQALLRALQRPEFNIHGVRRADLKPFVSDLSDPRLSRQLHRLCSLGLIKRVTRSYRYYLTRLGRAAIAAACSLTQFQIIPAIALVK